VYGEEMNEKMKKMRSESKTLKPAIIIGKNGINDQVIENIKKELKKSRLIKIRMLPTLVEEKNKKEIVADLLSKTGAKLVDFIGFTVTLTK
jgi:RNA-binding protein